MNSSFNTLRQYAQNDREQLTKVEGLTNKKEQSGVFKIKGANETYFEFSSVLDQHNRDIEECAKLQAEEDDLIISIRSLINGQL